MKTDLVVSACIVKDRKLLLIHHKKLDIWIPPGGHIEKDETPDDALRREIREEVGLAIRFLEVPRLRPLDAVRKFLATPLFVNVHTVGDHDHCGFFYLCEPADDTEVERNGETLGHLWIAEEELDADPRIHDEVRELARYAFRRYDELMRG